MKKTRIYFIEQSTDFNSDDLNSSKIAGAEKILINITNNLAKDPSLEIKVFNNTTNEKGLNNVSWINLKKINKYIIADHLISMSDANLLSLISSNKKYLWSHSVQSIEKFLRKKQLKAFLINKPIMILEGEYHFKNRSFLTSFFGKKVIKLAPDYDFIETTIDINKLPSQKAIFTTRSDRNLSFLLNNWKTISKNSPHSELHINPPYVLKDEDHKLNIKVRVKSDKSKLIQELADSRVMLNPGHKGEVFCLAAEEARELCVPIVTMGYGSLYERVDHNKTGFIAKNDNEFINYASKILNDNDTYLRLKENLLKLRGSKTYDQVSKNLLDILNENA